MGQNELKCGTNLREIEVSETSHSTVMNNLLNAVDNKMENQRVCWCAGHGWTLLIFYSTLGFVADLIRISFFFASIN